MATVTRRLPERPHLDVPKREARELLAQAREGHPEAWERIRHRHPKFQDDGNTAGTTISPASFKLADAQLVLAREYGFASWPELKRRVEHHATAEDVRRAIHAGDVATVVARLRAHPALLHVPLWSGNWGPPMSHAANLGKLEIVQAMAALGARDHQHAFERAVLQGQLECARWLHAQGAQLVPGVIMGACETLNAKGFSLLLELGAPLSDASGDHLAPLALVLETYARQPAGKHALLAFFTQLGFALPDTPVMALHRGDVVRLREHVWRDPALLSRRFGYREIYPPELGCAADDRSGLHWTPLAGTTLLHLAVDFQEREIFDWLLAAGADANARAETADGAPRGHTPLFNAMVNGPQRDGTMMRALLAHGADPSLRADLRKFLDWVERPRWHEARAVTAAEWARTFPDPGWVNAEALRDLEARM